MREYLGLQTMADGQDATRLILRILLMLVFLTIVIKGAYGRRRHSTDMVFTYWLFGIVTFSISFLLRKVPMELGFALGLFAVFGVLRYRTESIAVKDLTYLFVVIGIALINALANRKISFVEMVIVNGAISLATVCLEHIELVNIKRKPREGSIILTYDRVDMLAPSQRKALLSELSKRLNIPLTRVEVHNANLLRDTAKISVFFEDKDAPVQLPAA